MVGGALGKGNWNNTRENTADFAPSEQMWPQCCPGPSQPGHSRVDGCSRMSRDSCSQIQWPRPGGSCPASSLLGHSRSPNRQLITAGWRLAPLLLCSTECVMETGPEQTPLPRGSLACQQRTSFREKWGGGLRWRVSLLKQ